jgi:methyl-accepting chemotaxis protein
MNETQKKNRAGTRLSGWVCLACLSLALTGCSLLRFHHSPSKAEVTSLVLTTNSAHSVTFTVLQFQVMRFADSYVAEVAQAADEFSAKVGTPNARLAALKWKLGQATAAYTDATGPNPVVNALDMLVLVTITRMVIEDYGVETFGDAIQPVLETQRKLETNSWMVASGMLKPSQAQELRDLIQEWRKKNPHQRYVAAIRFREFATALNRMPSQNATAPTSIFSLLYLDPMAGLDPTTAAIEEMQQLGERAMYYTQRMPQLLNWQAELLAYQLAVQPESRQVLSNADQLAASAEMFAKTAQQLPQLVNDQRQAAIQQLLDGLTSQETQVRQTLNAGGDAATAIHGAIKSLDEFVRYVSPPNTNKTAGSTNSRPFNVLDYGTAAGQIGAAAKDLNTLLTTLNQSTTQLAQLGQQTTADANRVVDHAFRRGLILILVLLTGSVVAGLAYRVLADKIKRDGSK